MVGAVGRWGKMAVGVGWMLGVVLDKLGGLGIWRKMFVGVNRILSLVSNKLEKDVCGQSPRQTRGLFARRP
jgi:hypothetical protein